MSLQNVLKFQFWIGQNIDTALSIGQEKKVGIFVPWDLIDLKLELFFGDDLVSSDVYKTDQIFFVSNRDGFAVWSPGNVDIFSFGGVHKPGGQKFGIFGDFLDTIWLLFSHF